MPIMHRWMVLPILALTLLTRGVARPDSMWTVDGSSCQRFNCYPVSGGASERSYTKSGNECIRGMTSGGGYLWVLGVVSSRSILKVDPTDGSTVATLTLNTDNRGLSIAYGDGCLWVLLDNSQIAKVDPSSGQIIGNVAPSFGSPAFYVAHGGGFLWAVESSAQIRKIDPSTGAILQTLTPAGPACINALSFGDACLWAAGLMGAAKVSKIDPTNGAVLSTASFGIGWYITSIAYEGQAAPTPVTISAARNAQPGTQVALSSAIVTAQLSDCAYVESADRSSGIRIVGGPQLSVGDEVDIAGSIEMASGEKAVRVTTCTVTGTGTADPLGISARSLAVYAPNAGVAQSLGASGLCSVGLLVRTWGQVSARATGYFYVDDGSHPMDGAGFEGLRVLCDGITAPALNRRVQVTGISTLFPYADSWLPALRLRTSADLKLLD